MESVLSMRPDTLTLRGCDIDALTRSETVGQVMGAVQAQQDCWVVTVNVDILRRLVLDQSFVTLTRPATLRVADGMPLVWASKLAGEPLPERVCGSDLVEPLADAAARSGVPVLFLGGEPGAADEAAALLARRYPGLNVTTHCPPFGFEQDAAASQAVEDVIRESDARLVFVGLGCPKQEKLIAKLMPSFPGRAWLGVGFSFSFIAGRASRAPRWLQVIGLEWLHRLATEPARLWRRYLVDDIPFTLGLLLWAVRRRFSGCN
jgi:N-acetylglucosaminyldiphosphoundecaprenol N-acetyl-beta-D-mannosaminyltransferase